MEPQGVPYYLVPFGHEKYLIRVSLTPFYINYLHNGYQSNQLKWSNQNQFKQIQPVIRKKQESMTTIEYDTVKLKQQLCMTIKLVSHENGYKDWHETNSICDYV
eukprot:403332940